MTKYFAALLMLFVAWPSFAADPNGYTAEYECRTGGPNCNVDVVALTNQACQQTITTADSAGTINSKINGGSQYICVTNGDYSGKGIISITASGTSVSRKVLRYTRASDNDDEPWNQSSGNKAKLAGIQFNGGDYWIVHRLSVYGGTGNGNTIEFLASSNSDNNIINRIDASGGAVVVDIDGGADNNTVQNSVIHDGVVHAGWDVDCIAMGNNSDTHIVNNEVFGCTHQVYSWGNGFVEHLVIENNDIYSPPSMFTDCSGNYTPNNPNSPCAASEVALSLKATTASTNIAKVLHNRLWGTRWTDTGICCDSGASGQLVSISDQSSSAKYVQFQNNIVFDGPVGIQHPHTNAEGADNSHNSYVGNVVWKIYNYRSPGQGQTVELMNGNYEEWYLNTFVDAESWGDFGGANSDWRCNAWLDTGRRASSAGSGTQVDNGVFYGVTSYSTGSNNISKVLAARTNSTAYGVGTILRTSSTPKTSCTTSTDEGCFLYYVTTPGVSASSKPAYCTTLGCTANDGSIKVQAIRGPYTFYRKLKTGPQQIMIPYVRAHSSAPESYACPSTYTTRKGIGITN